jgi:hypothetical protein
MVETVQNSAVPVGGPNSDWVMWDRDKSTSVAKCLVFIEPPIFLGQNEEKDNNTQLCFFRQKIFSILPSDR